MCDLLGELRGPQRLQRREASTTFFGHPHGLHIPHITFTIDPPSESLVYAHGTRANTPPMHLLRTQQCTARWAGLTWDLSDLQGQTFTIVDAWENSTATFTYVFALCGNVDLLKSDLSDYLTSKCSNTKGASGEYMNHDAPAFQTVNGKYSLVKQSSFARTG